MPSNKKDDPRSPPGAKRRGKAVALMAISGWLAVAVMIADRVHATNMNGSLHNALVRSQTERHELSQELQRLSDEVDTLQNRLSRHQSRETQSAVNP